MSMSVRQTTPPGLHVVLYDGHCRFCTAAARKLLRLARPGGLTALSFQDPGVLERFPGLTFDVCMKQMQLVTPEGRVYGGFEAAVQALATRPLVRLAVSIYYLPGVRQLGDWLYSVVAANRYRISGKTAQGECESGTCALHFPAKSVTRNA